LGTCVVDDGVVIIALDVLSVVDAHDIVDEIVAAVVRASIVVRALSEQCTYSSYLTGYIAPPALV
jgi:hypothetical protein